jgi:hypothetical protein
LTRNIDRDSREEVEMIRQIDKSRFNIPLSGVLRRELAWYATADDTVLGVVLDLAEGYSWLVVTESDQGQGFAAIDSGGSLTEDDATAALHDAMRLAHDG